LRIEVDFDKVIHLTVKEGNAEVFGTALLLGDKLRVSGQNVAVFSWDGCTLQVEGQPNVAYISEDTPMSQYLNVHETLEARRGAAKASTTTSSQGPRCMIVGPTDSGKSTLSKILLNYAVRAGWAPCFVDLDVGQGAITVPGCLSATPVESPIDVEIGLPCDAPLVYYYGHISPSENASLYRHLVERLAAVLDARAARDAAARAAGMMINSMGWVEDLGYDLLKHSIETFKVDVVLVVGHERLYSQLVGELKNTGMQRVGVLFLLACAACIGVS
jgi:polyribonucleotide 5'-hydroxyl-kinase